MKVILVQKPFNLIDTIYIACRVCYSKKKIKDLIVEAAEKSDKEKIPLIKSVMSSGHLSTVEHVSYTFGIDGMTRIYTQQLVRHRLAAYSQQSQRYVRASEIIDEIRENAKSDYSDAPDQLEIYMDQVKQSIDNYNKMVDSLIEKGMEEEEAFEHARLILPNAVPSNILVTMNLREIIHVCNIRLCKRAQKEIRDVFSIVANMITNDHSFLSDYLVPKCKMIGYCNEHKSCKMIITKKELFNI